MINRFFTELGSCYNVFPDNTTQRIKRYPETGVMSLQPKSTLTVYITKDEYVALSHHVKLFEYEHDEDIFEFTQFSLEPKIGYRPFDLFIPDKSDKGGYFWRLREKSLRIGGLNSVWKNGPHYHIGHKIVHIE